MSVSSNIYIYIVQNYKLYFVYMQCIAYCVYARAFQYEVYKVKTCEKGAAAAPDWHMTICFHGRA